MMGLVLWLPIFGPLLFLLLILGALLWISWVERDPDSVKEWDRYLRDLERAEHSENWLDS